MSGTRTLELSRRGLAGLAFGAALVLAAPASAHHSAAMFDQTKTVTLTATVKEFKWMNPHAMIEVVTSDASGNLVDWNIEGSTPNILVRKGWSMHSLKAGDKVSLLMHPMKDGRQAGLMMAVTTASGEVLKDHDY